MHRKHLILMVLCCALPAVALAGLFYFQVELSKTALFALILLCPLSHLLIMGGMGRDHGASEHHAQEKDHG